jgi:iron(III) transport system ATP-binding protein
LSVLELRAVSKAFGAVQAVDAVSVDLPAGGRMAIVGPSGCGKTTLLRLIAGFEQTDAGTIVLGGEVLSQGFNWVPAHRRRIGYLPQDGALFPHLTVEDNIAFGLPRDGARGKRVAALMELVALDRAMLKRWPHELSGGQQQRVALARALALQPRLMLLDEPFSALDTGLRVATRKAVTKVLAEANVATILVTHDQSEALSFSDQLGVMREGRLVQVGAPVDLYLRPRDESTANFLGEALILPAQLADGWADCILGRVAVDDQQRRGPARILIRPEQLELSVVRHDVGDRQSFGTVVEVDYGGSVWILTVQLANGAECGESKDTITVRSSGIRVPAIGDTMRIDILGTAHVLGNATLSRQ